MAIFKKVEISILKKVAIGHFEKKNEIGIWQPCITKSGKTVTKSGKSLNGPF